MDRDGIGNDLPDLVHAPVGEGGLVQRILSDAGGVDPLHGGFEEGNRIIFGDILALHDPAGAVRRGTVPVRVSEAGPEQDPVAHIDRDDDGFPFFGENSPFPEHGRLKRVQRFPGNLIGNGVVEL